MTHSYQQQLKRFEAKYYPVENRLIDLVNEMEVTPHISKNGFYAYSKLGKQVLKQMGGSTTYGDRSVQDAQLLILWLRSINKKKDSDFISEIIVSLTCFILEAFARRFKCQLSLEGEQFLITIPPTGRKLVHLDEIDFGAVYRDHLQNTRMWLAIGLCTKFGHCTNFDSAEMEYEFTSTNEYYLLSSAWPDKLSALDDYILAISPTPLDTHQVTMLTHVVAGIIKERLPDQDWSVSDAKQLAVQSSLPWKKSQAVMEQIYNPNQTAVFDLVRSLSRAFNPPSEVIGCEDSIFVDPEDDKGVLKDRYQLCKVFGAPPHLVVDSMSSHKAGIAPYATETRKNHV